MANDQFVSDESFRAIGYKLVIYGITRGESWVGMKLATETETNDGTGLSRSSNIDSMADFGVSASFVVGFEGCPKLATLHLCDEDVRKELQRFFDQAYALGVAAREGSSP